MWLCTQTGVAVRNTSNRKHQCVSRTDSVLLLCIFHYNYWDKYLASENLEEDKVVYKVASRDKLGIQCSSERGSVPRNPDKILDDSGRHENNLLKKNK